jgi:type I restriction enzyme M protein
MTTVAKTRWIGEPGDMKRVRELKRQFEDGWHEEADAKADVLYRELRAELRKVDAAHNAALWREVKEIFDYPVFTASPEAVGITSTGAEGPNQLPDVLTAYRKFDAWLAAGAKPEQAPHLGP